MSRARSFCRAASPGPRKTVRPWRARGCGRVLNRRSTTRTTGTIPRRCTETARSRSPTRPSGQPTSSPPTPPSTSSACARSRGWAPRWSACRTPRAQRPRRPSGSTGSRCCRYSAGGPRNEPLRLEEMEVGIPDSSSSPDWRAAGSGLGQVVLNAVEEGRPPFLCPLVLLGRHASALLEKHLGPAFAEVGEEDGHQLILLLAGLIREGESEPLGLDHLAVLPLPSDLPVARADEHRRSPRAPLPDVHRDGGQGHVGLAAAEPVSESLGLGPLPPHLLARRLEDAHDRYPLLARGVAGRRLSHARLPSPSLLGAPRAGRSCLPRSDGTSRATREPP